MNRFHAPKSELVERHGKAAEAHEEAATSPPGAWVRGWGHSCSLHVASRYVDFGDRGAYAPLHASLVGDHSEAARLHRECREKLLSEPD